MKTETAFEVTGSQFQKQLYKRSILDNSYEKQVWQSTLISELSKEHEETKTEIGHSN